MGDLATKNDKDTSTSSLQFAVETTEIGFGEWSRLERKTKRSKSICSKIAKWSYFGNSQAVAFQLYLYQDF